MHQIERSKDNCEVLRYKLDEEAKKFRLVQYQNNELHDSLQNTKDKSKLSPPIDYVLKIRKFIREIDKFWLYVRTTLQKVLNETKLNVHQVLLNKLLADGQYSHHRLVGVIDDISETDGFKSWREREAHELTELVQKRLFVLQNPKNCFASRKLLCNLNIDCGFGCQIHHVVYCLIVAYGTNRTLLLESKKWNYGEGAFEKMFMPLSETCTSSNIRHGTKRPNWWPGNKHDNVIMLPRMRDMKSKPHFLPPAIPKDLSDRIIRIHGDPVVWWISQFLKYILRLNKNMFDSLKYMDIETMSKYPTVGIHVRRTDKLEKEAEFHPVEEYMKPVADFFHYISYKYDN